MKNIAAAFLKAQSEMATPKKTNSNPFFKSKYADLNSVLEAVMQPLHDNEISVLQPTVCVDGKNYVKTILLHSSGETLESFTEILYNKPNDAQAQGSGITYARRYGLQSLSGVGADDDDGNGASKTTTKTQNANLEENQAEQQRRLEIQLDLDSAGTTEELGEKYKSLSGSDQVIFKKYVTDLKAKLTSKK